MSGYNETLNLPKTDFPMRASLPEREPVMLEKWYSDKLYESIIENNEGKPMWVLHDGPPYANNGIHLGTAMNKVLKDILVRYKNLAGFKSPYRPGWDTHGLPIELKAMKKVAEEKRELTPLEVRSACREYALHYVDVQREQFKRLGVLGEWDDPYLTLRPEFEARQLKVFGEMAEKGYIYKGKKAVYWCPECATALAEAEIEYSDDPCESIFVRFNVCDDNGTLAKHGIPADKCWFVIWTTTTWTLPGNVAICLGADFDYSVTKVGDDYYILADELAEGVLTAAGLSGLEKVAVVKGRELERIWCRHPFLERKSMIILGDHVVLEDTGCVHTAPGHGVEDFEVVTENYPELPIVVPVDDHGYMTAEAGQFEGITTAQANTAILEHIKKTGHLLAKKDIVHQYPHCWRCKKPILFRATEQWFCSVDDFKDDTVSAINTVKWTPSWAKDRITGMVKDRRDWCISRQRSWGVPIPAFYCKKCGKYHLNKTLIDSVYGFVLKEGSDAWWKHTAEEFVPAGYKCDCGGTEFTKDDNIMDVWFDSGTTHFTVLEDSERYEWPCDMYLEGSDQYRGWFQSSLLTSVACTGKAPYREVLSHGWVVDGEGRKMSKSLGNGIEPEEIVNQYGADILRLWVASSDYQTDVRISKDILKQLSESYRKIRNTARFILGNISDFDPDKDMVPYEELEDIDRFALSRLDELIAKTAAYYDEYEFHGVYHSLHNFCVVDMSNFYLDVLKDRLYVESADSKSRRAAQTVIYKVLTAIDVIMAPIIPFTAEEIWGYLPADSSLKRGSVMLSGYPKQSGAVFTDTDAAKWQTLVAVRSDVQKALELARTDKVIGASLEAKTVLHAEGELFKLLNDNKALLESIFIVSAVEVLDAGQGSFVGEVEGLSVTVEKAVGDKCERCWSRKPAVGTIVDHPTLCERCAKIVK